MTDDDDEAALPYALYPLKDETYGNRNACEAERAAFAEADRLPWGKGALLLNPKTKSYLTPFGFKALFEDDEDIIRLSFERAGLDLDKSYFQGGAPDILIRNADGRFIPSSDLPPQAETLPLTLRFREEDIYLQNFGHDGSKHTGSYTPYTRADNQLRERHGRALAGETRHIPAADRQTRHAEPISQRSTEKRFVSAQRTFTRTSRDKRRSARHSRPREHKEG